jgi:hypothetical protein
MDPLQLVRNRNANRVFIANYGIETPDLLKTKTDAKIRFSEDYPDKSSKNWQNKQTIKANERIDVEAFTKSLAKRKMIKDLRTLTESVNNASDAINDDEVEEFKQHIQTFVLLSYKLKQSMYEFVMMLKRYNKDIYEDDQKISPKKPSEAMQINLIEQIDSLASAIEKTIEDIQEQKELEERRKDLIAKKKVDQSVLDVESAFKSFVKALRISGE